MSKLKVAVVGVGGIARVHMPGWEASEHAEVVAGYDVSPDFLKIWGASHGVDQLYDNYEELLANKEIDIVDICVPNMYHSALTVAALDAGKHVLCEKPLGPHARIDRAHDRGARPLRQDADDGAALPLQGHVTCAQGRNRCGRAGRRLPRALVDAAPRLHPGATGLYVQKEQRRRRLHRHRRTHFGLDAVDDGQPDAGGRERRGQGDAWSAGGGL